MARRKTQFAQGAYYHIYNRGANRTSIFLCEQDYLDVRNTMREYAGKYSISIIAYCLMPNHYHWLVRQNGIVPARLLPQHVFNRYVKSFNLRNHHSGTLFEGPFEAILIKETTHLRHLCRYIHANPVKDNFVTKPEHWPHSNYLEWIGQRNSELVDHAFIREYFPKVANYPRWVAAYLSGLDSIPLALRQYFARFEE